MEENKYFFRVEYSIEDGTFREPEEVLKTNLWAAKATKQIDNYTYEFDRREDGKHYSEKDLVYLLKIYSNLNKSDLQLYFNNNSLNSESYKIL